MVLNPHTIQSYCICCCYFSRFLQATFNLFKKNSLLETSIFLEFSWKTGVWRVCWEFSDLFHVAPKMHFNMEGWGLLLQATQSHQEGGSFPEWPWHISWMTFACVCCPLQGVSPGSMWSLDWGSHSLLSLPLKQAYSNDFPKLIWLLNPCFQGFPINNSMESWFCRTKLGKQ